MLWTGDSRPRPDEWGYATLTVCSPRTIQVSFRMRPAKYIFGDYRRAPQVLTNLTDEPLGFPQRFRPLIRYKAMEFYYLWDETARGLQSAVARYKQMFSVAQLALTPRTRVDSTFIGI